MKNKITELSPDLLWKHFYDLTQIPRPSKKEAKAVAHLIELGKKLNLETLTDEIGNVLIRKPATKGFENLKGVVLQAHIDMVPQKNAHVEHNFETDPIDAYIDGDWVTAHDTTLGADNGIGMATMMAILESDSLDHGPIEALFTIDEETGMTGVGLLRTDWLQGEILINLDSEDEGEICIGCAGGIDTIAKKRIPLENICEDKEYYKLAIKGLKGGHSGIDIHLGRANANLLMADVLMRINNAFNIDIASFEGGNVRNAIPREAFAVIGIAPKQMNDLQKLIEDTETKTRKIFEKTEQNITYVLEKTPVPLKVFCVDETEQLLRSIINCPNGVIRMYEGIEGLVETSSNLAIVKQTVIDEETAEIEIGMLQRSASDPNRNLLCADIKKLFEIFGFTVEHKGGYPGWKPNFNSPVLKIMSAIHNEVLGFAPKIMVIHAGLECGMIGAKYPGIDAISIGPTIRYPHSPDEKVNIKTVSNFWEYLLAVLKQIPVLQSV